MPDAPAPPNAPERLPPSSYYPIGLVITLAPFFTDGPGDADLLLLGSTFEFWGSIPAWWPGLAGASSELRHGDCAPHGHAVDLLRAYSIPGPAFRAWARQVTHTHRRRPREPDLHRVLCWGSVADGVSSPRCCRRMIPGHSRRGKYSFCADGRLLPLARRAGCLSTLLPHLVTFLPGAGAAGGGFVRRHF